MSAPRVLAVDDTPHNLDLIAYLLASSGHEVLRAETGEDALQCAAAERPDLIVLDLQLPGMDGYDVLRELRSDPATVDVPVVAVTAYAMASDRAQALAAGFDGYVSKPIDPTSFAATITSYLPAELRATLPRSAQAD